MSRWQRPQEKQEKLADGEAALTLPEHEQKQLPHRADHGDAVEAGHKDNPLKHPE